MDVKDTKEKGAYEALYIPYHWVNPGCMEKFQKFDILVNVDVLLDRRFNFFYYVKFSQIRL